MIESCDSSENLTYNQANVNYVNTLMPNRFATIDLGSNSFHLLIAELEHGEIRTLESTSDRVMLAEGLSKESGIHPDAMARGIASIRRFAQRLRDIQKHHIKIVGTNTLRAARNAGEFVPKLETILGTKIHVISGLEEARLIYLGVSQSWSMADKNNRLLVLDIGGGSTEVMFGKAFKLKAAESLRMGCIAFRRFFDGGRISHAHYQKALQAAIYEANQSFETFENLRWHQAVGSAGTFKAIEAILIANGQSEGGIDINGINWLKQQLLSFEQIEHIELDGLKAGRQPSILPGLAICEALFTVLDIENLHIARGGLREGVLYDLIGQDNKVDIRARSIVAICNRYKPPQLHALRCRFFAEQLLTNAGFHDEINNNKLAQELLFWACDSLQIGLVINHSQYQMHSAYLLRNSELRGFSLRERALLATIVANHRRKLDAQMLQRECDHNPSSSDSLSFNLVIKIIMVLRISHLLAQCEHHRVPILISLRESDRQLIVTIDNQWMHERPALEYALDLEVKYWAKSDLPHTLVIELK